MTGKKLCDCSDPDCPVHPHHPCPVISRPFSSTCARCKAVLR